MSALYAAGNPIISRAPAADYSAKEGCLCTFNATTATISASATVPAAGVILEGGADADSKISVGVLGALPAPVRVKLGGAVTGGDRLQQNTDETVVTDAGTGSRRIVGRALETGVSGDLILAVLHVPILES